MSPKGNGTGPPKTGGGFGSKDGRGRVFGGQGQRSNAPGQGPKTGGAKGPCK